MISLQTLATIGSAAAIVIGYLYAKNTVQKRLLNQKQQEIEKVRSEAAAIAKELDNADKRKKIEARTTRLGSSDVDKRLHERGEFRDD